MNRVCATFYLHHTMIIGESIPERQPVNLRLMNPGSRTHCSLHSTRRTAASTPQTLLVASICRVAGNTLPQYMTDCCIHSPHLRHCSSAASDGWKVTPHHSTRRTAASTPQTLLVASICGPPAAISCSYSDTGVPCSVVGPFL